MTRPLLLCCALATVPLAGTVAQTPLVTPRDTSALRAMMRRLNPRERIAEPTVIAISPLGDSLVPARPLPRGLTRRHLDQSIAAARRLASQHGFRFVVRAAGGLGIVDPQYAAYYVVPTDLAAGYVIVSPGHHPVELREVTDTLGLADALSRYSSLVRPLAERR